MASCEIWTVVVGPNMRKAEALHCSGESLTTSHEHCNKELPVTLTSKELLAGVAMKQQWCNASGSGGNARMHTASPCSTMLQ